MLQKLSPQQIQLMKLLQVPTMALEQRIKEELELNPALEEGKEEKEDEEELSPQDEISENGQEEKEETEEAEEENEEKEELPDEVQADEMPDDFDISEYVDDEEEADYKYYANNSSPDDERNEIPVSAVSSFQDQLITQLGTIELDQRQEKIALQLIGSLDDDGYLRRDLNALVDDLAFSQNIITDDKELLSILKLIQGFDPAGIGARNLQECLLLQLQRKNQLQEANQTAIRIVTDFMDEFSRKHYDKIERTLNLTEAEFKESINEILHCNPRPGNTMWEGLKSVQHIIPDFILTNYDGSLELSLNTKNAPELRISKTYSNMLQEYNKDKKNRSSREAMTFVKQKIDSAKWFIDAIKQRQHTLLTTMKAIMEYQKEYFVEGDEKLLKPMILKDIADIVGLDISTVSRVANSKYVQTPFGTFLLKTFFSEALSTDTGEEVSSREVKKILTEQIGNENKRRPLPDDQLARILRDKGYNIARRTVAKYREQLNIPVARLRRQA